MKGLRRRHDVERDLESNSLPCIDARLGVRRAVKVKERKIQI